jgi:hypothetical protein
MGGIACPSQFAIIDHATGIGIVFQAAIPTGGTVEARRENTGPMADLFARAAERSAVPMAAPRSSPSPLHDRTSFEKAGAWTVSTRRPRAPASSRS